jgi:C-terminal processing protease CtpA/Prc
LYRNRTDDGAFATQSPSSSASSDDIVVYAPAGRLGLSFGPGLMVRSVRDGSAVEYDIEVGDVLLSVDEVDVRKLDPVDVSRILHQRSHNPVRKLVLTCGVSKFQQQQQQREEIDLQ